MEESVHNASAERHRCLRKRRAGVENDVWAHHAEIWTKTRGTRKSENPTKKPDPWSQTLLQQTLSPIYVYEALRVQATTYGLNAGGKPATMVSARRLVETVTQKNTNKIATWILRNPAPRHSTQTQQPCAPTMIQTCTNHQRRATITTDTGPN